VQECNKNSALQGFYFYPITVGYYSDKYRLEKIVQADIAPKPATIPVIPFFVGSPSGNISGRSIAISTPFRPVPMQHGLEEPERARMSRGWSMYRAPRCWHDGFLKALREWISDCEGPREDSARLTLSCCRAFRHRALLEGAK